MITLPARPKPRRRSSERLDVVLPIVSALNGMPGVWAAENETVKIQTPGGAWIARNRLGEGSGDVIFTVQITLTMPSGMWRVEMARIGWLECKTQKTATKRVDHAKRDDHQASWAEAMRRKGHFVAGNVTTVDQAMAAVERCRAGGYR